LNKVRANQIAIKALQTRKKFLGAGASEPICSFNLAEAMGLDVRFIKISSFEGMYLTEENLILVSAERPEGRKSFTCAHELGHHVLGHGTVIDEIIESGSDKDIEKEADFFAGTLLMPASAVQRAAKDIGIHFQAVTPEQIYILSKYLSVSYQALVNQSHFNLRLIDTVSYQRLRNVKVREIKNRLFDRCAGSEVFIVGNWWRGRAIDVVVGDHIVTDVSTYKEGAAISNPVDESGKRFFQAMEPGIAKISDDNGWSAFVRVSRKHFAGMCQFRYEEEVE